MKGRGFFVSRGRGLGSELGRSIRRGWDLEAVFLRLGNLGCRLRKLGRQTPKVGEADSGSWGGGIRKLGRRNLEVEEHGSGGEEMG